MIQMAIFFDCGSAAPFATRVKARQFEPILNGLGSYLTVGKKLKKIGKIEITEVENVQDNYGIFHD